MKKHLAAAFVFGKALFPPETPEAERMAKLKPFFEPPLGETLTLDPLEMHKAAKDPIRTRGFVVVTPPKGHCWIVKRHDERPDTNVCQRTTLSFEAGAIDDAGRVTWEVKTGKGDFGTPVSWQTPYRLAQLIPSGEFTKQLGDFVPVISCVAERKERKIRVELLGGETWVVYFPESDSLTYPQPEEAPNLDLQKVSDTTAFKKKEEGSMIVAPAGAERYPWIMPARGSYAMSSSRIKMADAPDGLNGLCRYRLSGAPRDPKGGAVECFNAERYDAVYLPLTCSPELLD